MKVEHNYAIALSIYFNWNVIWLTVCIVFIVFDGGGGGGGGGEERRRNQTYQLEQE